MHGATAADNKLAGEKRELLEDTLFEKRTLSAAQQAARAAARNVARVASRPAARPQVLARPLFKPAVPPAAPPRAPGTFANNAKKVGKFTAMGLTGGVGEYFGGRTMSNMLENLDKHDKRSLAEDDEELYARNPPLRSIARVGGTVMRTAARRGGNRVNTVAHSLPRPFAGAAVENGLQTLTPEAAEKIKHDPKGTITKMVKGPVFGRPAGDKRELGDDEDLAARDATFSGFDR
ncbi:hypothetical protein CPB84DRAFT_1794615 [Gymnopilus junonius]|uniref:Uncharacterized protein n=1 Tax=Gymnopilus junonius TaxID=109634 RepID=A0A9P5TGD4_GYMJU|nr:hypothetical protein CPB84DRAFT_1794615 [Gymnopilus junonius]